MHRADFLEALERKLAELTGIPEGAVIVIPPFSMERFEPQDIRVYIGPGHIDLLSNMYPDHFRAMQEYGRSHLSFRIAVSKEYRRVLYDQADKVREYMLQLDV